MLLVYAADPPLSFFTDTTGTLNQNCVWPDGVSSNVALASTKQAIELELFSLGIWTENVRNP